MTASVIIVLGYKNIDNGELHAIGKQRADKAFEVYQQQCKLRGKIQLICTGGFGENFNQSKTAHGKLVQTYLESKGIKSEAFLPHAASKNTYEDARFCAETVIAQALKLHEIHLVTSEFHMKRGFLWLTHFFPQQKILCHPAKTTATKTEMQTLLDHEQQAVANFYRDFPDALKGNHLPLFCR